VSLTLESQLAASFDFFAKRREEKDVRKYCTERGLCPEQITVCLSQLRMYGMAEAKETADRIAAKMWAIRTRCGTRPDPPSAA